MARNGHPILVSDRQRSAVLSHVFAGRAASQLPQGGVNLGSSMRHGFFRRLAVSADTHTDVSCSSSGDTASMLSPESASLCKELGLLACHLGS